MLIHGRAIRAIRVRVTNMQALARDQVRRYSEGHGFGKASGPHTIYLTLTLIALIALTWSEPPCDLIESIIQEKVVLKPEFMQYILQLQQQQTQPQGINLNYYGSRKNTTQHYSNNKPNHKLKI